MKRIYLSILLCLMILRGLAQQVPFLDEGSAIADYPKVDWLQGEPISHFDKDKIYVVELWATWCKPCIAAMPHLNGLHQKFKDKKVVFIAQDVMEADVQKVLAFVKENGDKMSFRVAFSGMRGSDFDTKWVRAAGVNSIPQTFIIQNNTLVWQTDPNMLNEEVLQLLVDGKFTIKDAEAIAKKHN
ncbi:AhpC/TSA family protein [Mucilaginibacter gracilis]|uniref:AhpC/TSA family protein n=1 Tax=Mucilaginibacter gracilis TaxID=423350 RepID=A0A495J1T4_9SPHI|nr:TlpA disulfide reductase family protein [Mucilaginibacter gracilis]RKR82930.1 AhpC/TSA family protein [Mucilaginibacter gracilis]